MSEYGYVRRSYGVEPKVGLRVRHTELKPPRDLGVIAPESLTHGHYVQVIFDGHSHASNCHPTALDYAPDDRDRLPMWVIYDHPSDHPNSFVARRWITLPEPQFTAQIRTTVELTELRQCLQRDGLVPISRHPFDDLRILEVWL